MDNIGVILIGFVVLLLIIVVVNIIYSMSGAGPLKGQSRKKRTTYNNARANERSKSRNDYSRERAHHTNRNR